MDDTPQEEQTKKLGRGMIIIAWIVIFAMLIWFFEKNKRNPNQNIATQITSDGEKQVVLESSRYGHYVATGKINNTEVTFLVDTGASHVSIPEEVATKIGLKRGAPMLVNTANGTITVFATTLPVISLGEIKLYDIKADINPHMGGDEILLGMSFLRDLSITHQGDQLTIRQ